MICGLGTDIVKVERLKEMIERYGNDFLEKIFTPAELKEAKKRRDPSEYYAGRWAVKEAVSKSMGCGIGEFCSWLDIETVNGVAGDPVVSVSGTGRKTFQKLGAETMHVSISHEKEYATATVILEKTTP
ncbi:MAG: holo-ACP synthase [Victivallaceae bacterium]